MSKPREWRSIEINWEDGTRTELHRYDMEKLVTAANVLRDLDCGIKIAEDLLRLREKIRE